MSPAKRFAYFCLIIPVFLSWMIAASIPPAQAVEPPNEFYLTVKVKGKFSRVFKDLKKAIRVNNFFVGDITDLDAGLKKRGGLASVGVSHYKIIGFCNLTLAAQALAINPDIGVFMPCRLAVYQKIGSDEVTISAMRPSYMARVFKEPKVKKLAAKLERVLMRILDDVQF